MQAAPLFDDVAKAPKGGQAHWLQTADGTRIRVAFWTGKGVRGTVLLFPGRTEYIEKYGLAAGELLARGYATAVIDWRGQGLADRLNAEPLLGHVDQFPDYQHDVAAMLDHVRALGLPEPYHLLAHSMGGCIGLRSLNQGLPVRSAVFSAPMWGIMMSQALRPAAWALSTISTPLRFGTAFAPGQNGDTYVLRVAFADNTLTNDPDMFAYMQTQLRAHPELTIGGPSLHWLNESLREMRRLSQQPSPALPCITYLGEQEAIVDPVRVRQRMAKWEGGTLVMLPRAKHEVMMELPATRNAVFDGAAALFAAQSVSA
jgi:lysophospholipase